MKNIWQKLIIQWYSLNTHSSWLTSTARVCPAVLARTWKRRTTEASDWPPSREVPPLCTTIGFPPKILMRWRGSFPWITRTFINMHIQAGVTELFWRSMSYNSAPGGPLSWRAPILSKHTNLQIKFFRIARNLQASVLGQIGAKLCRILALHEHVWTTFGLKFSRLHIEGKCCNY